MFRGKRFMIAGGVLALSAAWTTARAGEEALPKCPVTGEPANFNVSTTTPDGPVFFCCKKCVASMEKEPAKYAAAVAEQRKAMENRAKVQVACPVSGEPIDPKVSIEHEGQKIHFCCPKCIDQYKAEPAKYKTALAKAYTYQTKCPVSGEDINPTTAAVLPSGEKVYTCCKMCLGKLGAAGEKVAASLAAQGYPVKADDLKKAKPAEEKEGG